MPRRRRRSRNVRHKEMDRGEQVKSQSGFLFPQRSCVLQQTPNGPRNLRQIAVRSRSSVRKVPPPEVQVDLRRGHKSEVKLQPGEARVHSALPRIRRPTVAQVACSRARKIPLPDSGGYPTMARKAGALREQIRLDHIQVTTSSPWYQLRTHPRWRCLSPCQSMVLHTTRQCRTYQAPLVSLHRHTLLQDPYHLSITQSMPLMLRIRHILLQPDSHTCTGACPMTPAIHTLCHHSLNRPPPTPPRFRDPRMLPRSRRWVPRLARNAPNTLPLAVRALRTHRKRRRSRRGGRDC